MKLPFAVVAKKGVIAAFLQCQHAEEYALAQSLKEQSEIEVRRGSDWNLVALFRNGAQS